MDPRPLEAGDVVQINPEKTAPRRAFAGCLLIVTEPKTFGCQGYVPIIGETYEEPGGRAFLRLSWDEMEYVGRATWGLK